MYCMLPFAAQLPKDFWEGTATESSILSLIAKAGWNLLYDEQLALTELGEEKARQEAVGIVFNAANKMVCQFRSEIGKISQAFINNPSSMTSSLLVGALKEFPLVKYPCKVYANLLETADKQDMEAALREISATVASLEPAANLSLKPLQKLDKRLAIIQAGLNKVDLAQGKLTAERGGEILTDIASDKKHAMQNAASVEKIREISQAARVGMLVLNAVVDRVNPNAAKHLNVIGHSVINIAESTSLLRSMMASGSTWLQMVGPIGIIVGTAIGALDFYFKRNTTDIPLVTLKLLSEVAETVGTMRTEMHARFDRLELILSHQYVAIMDKLVELSQQIENLNQAMERNFRVIYEKIDDLIQAVNDGITMTLKRSLIEQAAKLTVSIRHKSKLSMTREDYKQYARDFLSWSEELAKQPSLAGKQDMQLKIDKHSAIGILTKPWEHSLNTLVLIARQHYSVNLSNVQLPNPSVWAFAIFQYLRLRLNWPDFDASPVSSLDDDPIRHALVSETKQLEDFVAALQKKNKNLLLMVLGKLKACIEALKKLSVSDLNPNFKNHDLFISYQFHYLFLYRLCEIALSQSMRFDPLLVTLMRDLSADSSAYLLAEDIRMPFFNLPEPKFLLALVNKIAAISSEQLAEYRLKILFSNMLGCTDVIKEILRVKFDTSDNQQCCECPVIIRQTKDSLIGSAKRLLVQAADLVGPATQFPHAVDAKVLVPEDISSVMMIDNVDVLTQRLDQNLELLNYRDSQGRNLVHMAAFADAVACLQALISRGVNVNEVDVNGNSPLHVAAEQNVSGVVASLIVAGSNRTAKNKQGKTPINIADDLKHQDFLSALRDANPLRNWVKRCKEEGIGLKATSIDTGAVVSVGDSLYVFTGQQIIKANAHSLAVEKRLPINPPASEIPKNITFNCWPRPHCVLANRYVCFSTYKLSVFDTVTDSYIHFAPSFSATPPSSIAHEYMQDGVVLDEDRIMSLHTSGMIRIWSFKSKTCVEEIDLNRLLSFPVMGGSIVKLDDHRVIVGIAPKNPPCYKNMYVIDYRQKRATALDSIIPELLVDHGVVEFDETKLLANLKGGGIGVIDKQTLTISKRIPDVPVLDRYSYSPFNEMEYIQVVYAHRRFGLSSYEHKDRGFSVKFCIVNIETNAITEIETPSMVLKDRYNQPVPLKDRFVQPLHVLSDGRLLASPAGGVGNMLQVYEINHTPTMTNVPLPTQKV